MSNYNSEHFESLALEHIEASRSTHIGKWAREETLAKAAIYAQLAGAAATAELVHFLHTRHQ